MMDRVPIQFEPLLYMFSFLMGIS